MCCMEPRTGLDRRCEPLCALSAYRRCPQAGSPYRTTCGTTNAESAETLPCNGLHEARPDESCWNLIDVFVSSAFMMCLHRLRYSDTFFDFGGHPWVDFAPVFEHPRQRWVRGPGPPAARS